MSKSEGLQYPGDKPDAKDLRKFVEKRAKELEKSVKKTKKGK